MLRNADSKAEFMDLYEIRNALAQGKSIFDLALRVTYYARVSTDKDEQIHSLKAQIDYYTDFIKANPNWTFVPGYIDEGISGTSVAKRESFMQMMDDAQLRKFDFIITKEISRFSRNTVDSIQYTQKLLSYGIGVFFQSDNINTLLPDSELRLTIMSSIAQDEVRKLSERVKFGFKRAIEKGVVLGNDNLWGYRKDNGRLVVVEEEAEIVRKIFEMYATDGVGIRAIAKWLDDHGYKNSKGNPFSFSTIRKIISNPKYKGYYCGGKTHKTDYKLKDIKQLDESEWVMYKDETGEVVPAIVSEGIWDKANRILSRRSAKMSSEDRTSYQNKYKYSGKLICMEHHAPYYRACYHYKSGDKEVWQCREFSTKGRAGCQSPTVYTTELDEVMRQVADLLIENKAEIIQKMMQVYCKIGEKSSIKTDIAKLETEIKTILQRKDKILDLNINGKLSDEEFQERNRRYNDEVDSLRIRIADLKEQQTKSEDIAESIETLRGIITRELNFEEGMDATLIDRMVDRIEVHKTDEKQRLVLKVFLKVLEDDCKLPFYIKRSRKETSVCYAPST
ncbi:recombinase family protein [Anaerotruncus colihominis]|uniref:recombinase family protein n=1 Tax=Anaerotruncus colihominis TaxID=169435 RepID=UPI00242B08DF|nr:recombinase family protein [Anaerotruncus colihominis]